MKARYRIVRDGYAGYEVQAWRWWLPFWTQVGFCNTWLSIEQAEAFAKACATKRVVKDLGWL